MRVYENFAESSILVFGAGAQILEQAHNDLICCLMNELDRVAAESVKTPPEVVLLGKQSPAYSTSPKAVRSVHDLLEIL